MNKKIGTAIIVALILLFAYTGINYLVFHSNNAVTDAAFIRSDHLSTLSFQTSGNVISMTKKENDAVTKGELLAIIDPTDLQASREELIHQIDATQAQILATQLEHKRLVPSLALQTSMSNHEYQSTKSEQLSLNAQIQASQERLNKLSLDEKRYSSMLKERLISQNDYEIIHTQTTVAHKELEALNAKRDILDSLHNKAKNNLSLTALNEQQASILLQKILAQQEQKKVLESSLKSMNNQIGYTHLYAPYNGIVAKKFIQAPSMVKAGSPIYSIADPISLYVEVLLSEKELHGVEVNNAATVKPDALKNITYDATVESISPTSASTFSLVPRDIASGEFTKLDQRFIVRLKLKNSEKLRSGMGATVAIKRT